MNTSKKVALSLVAGIFAIGFSAFTVAKKQSAVYYGQTLLNHYVRLSGMPTGDCETTTPNACTIRYEAANDPSVSTFDITPLSPAPANGVASSEKTLYNP